MLTSVTIVTTYGTHAIIIHVKTKQKNKHAAITKVNRERCVIEAVVVNLIGGEQHAWQCLGLEFSCRENT